MSDLLDKLRASYAEANELAKMESLFVGKAIIPAHNELRNAGYHILKAIRDPSEIDDDHIRMAIDHCERATYDAAEAALIKVIDTLNDYLGRFKHIPVNEVVPDVANTRRLIREGTDLLIKGREHESFDLERVVAVLKGLVDAHHLIEGSLPDLNAVLERDIRLARRTLIVAGIGATSAVIGSIMRAILSTFLP
ncbi:MAG: hypothetical protein OXM62_03690 [bacterium]|nr:hypothetical protein [bacterium]